MFLYQAVKFARELRDEERAGLADVIIVGECLLSFCMLNLR